MTNPQREVVWAGRGDRWVTRLIYAAKSWPVAVKVVNISDKDVWIDNRTPVARIVEYGFSRVPGALCALGRSHITLILENVQLREGRIRAERLAALEPPCVDTPKYPWPTKILSRSAKGPDTALLASILRKPKIRRVRFAEDASTQTDEMPPRGFRESRDMAVDTNDLSSNSLTDEVASTASYATETPSLRMELGSDFQRLRDQLVMLPEIKDLTPECKIEEADVGVPGKTTPEMEDQVRRILEYHRKISWEMAMQLPHPLVEWSIAPHLWPKVYELLKKLLENGLIETSGSPWAFPIVIVLKKNGVDIR
ncbi:Aspartic protease, partial [Phytophthora palmivora]